MTGSDEIIEEIRQSRRNMSKQCGHDMVQYLEYLKQFDSKYAAQVAKFRRLHRPSTEMPAPGR